MGILETGINIFKKVKEGISNAISNSTDAEVTEHNEAESKELQRQNNGEIQDIEQLENKLKDYSSKLSSLSKETDHKIVLANSLKAQLEVISVAKNPSLCKSALDLMIQSLSEAAEEIDDEKELRNIQKRAALMTNNMIFFFDAYIHYQEDKKSNEGQKLLEKACDTLAKTTNDIFKEIADDPKILAGGIKSIAFVSGKTLVKNIIDEGLINKILDFIFKEKRLEELKNNYYDFLIEVIEKLKRHKRLFGRSVVLSELIHNKKREIAEYEYPIPLDHDNYVSVILWPTLGILGIILILFIVLGIIKLIDLTPADLTNAANNVWTAIKYSAIADGIALVITSIINIIRKIAYNKSVRECFINRELSEKNLSDIADSLNS